MPGKRIAITGVSRGCGRALVDEFIAGGHTVSGCARSGIDALREACSAPHHFDAVDVTDDGSVRAWAEATIAAHGAPDLVVANAGVINRSAPLWELDADEVGRVIDINIKGVTNTLRAFLPAMIAAGSGVVVAFSSGWGRSTAPEVAPYCASKYAIEGLMSALAQELPPGLAAVPLNPGIINTPMLQSCWPDGAHDFAGPEDWARTAAPFLVALDATANGQPLTAP